MNTGYQLAFILLFIVTAPFTFARILHHHDDNQLQSFARNDTADRKGVSVTGSPKGSTNRNEVIGTRKDGYESMKYEKNSLMDSNNLEPHNNEIRKRVKKARKSHKKFAKRSVDSRTKDLKNALEETLKMTEESSRGNARRKGLDEFPNDDWKLNEMSMASESLIVMPKGIESEHKLERKKKLSLDKMSTEGINFEEPPDERKDSLSFNMKDELEYYTGEPTKGKKLPGPNIKELVERFKELRNRNENISTNFTRISDSGVRTEKSIPSQQRVRERIALQGNSNVDVITDEAADRPNEQIGNGNKGD